MEPAVWHYRETGSGPTLILLHGIGMSHTAWSPVTPYLCSEHRVIAFDIAGFGETPPLPGGVPPTIPHLVDALELCFERMGLTVPADIVGNSLGGTMALEAGRRGLARTVVAISPAGLWAEHGARHVPLVFATLRYGVRRFPRLLKVMMRASLMRELALAIPLSVGSRRMSATAAAGAVNDLARSTAFEATFDNTRTAYSAVDISVPVTVAFGESDWILPPASQRRDQLPPHTNWVRKPGWGHVPMWVDPRGVAALILQGIRSPEPHRDAGDGSALERNDADQVDDDGGP
jgi:pimeloyl-ACP methyl ester carboxylesterase